MLEEEDENAVPEPDVEAWIGELKGAFLESPFPPLVLAKPDDAALLLIGLGSGRLLLEEEKDDDDESALAVPFWNASLSSLTDRDAFKTCLSEPV